MNRKTFRIISALVFFWALMPVLTGGCPCALAAVQPHPGLVLQKIPCHGCCPEIKSGHLTQDFELAEPAGFQLSGRHARFYSPSSDALPGKVPERSAAGTGAPPGVPFGEAHSSFSTPLYLTLQVFRV